MARSRSAPTSRLKGCGCSGVKAGVRQAAIARTVASTATLANAGPVPVTDAIPPSTGPNSAPTIAAPITAPIVSPRRSAGAAATSHASDAVHENELATPCRNRAVSSSQIESANPKVAVVTAIPVRPTRTVGRTPKRAAEIPPGIPPTSAPSAYDAASRPAPAFESPSSSAYCGRSGVSAAKNIVSTKTIAPTSRSSLRTRYQLGLRLSKNARRPS